MSGKYKRKKDIIGWNNMKKTIKKDATPNGNTNKNYKLFKNGDKKDNQTRSKWRNGSVNHCKRDKNK